MRIFLTGASGFLGACALREFLGKAGAQTAVLVRDPAAAWRIADLLPRTKVVVAGIEDEATLETALGDFAPTHLVHLAWTGVAGRNRNDAAQHRNAYLSMRLVEMGIAAGARHFIGLGSHAEYGPCHARIDESTPTAPTTMYGASKLSACLMTERLCANAGARFAWLRLFSSYGPRDSPEWLIPYLALKLLRGERPSVTAAGQRWDYIYVDDAARAVVAVTSEAGAAGVFNLGSGTATRLRDIIERVRDEIDPALPVGFGEIPYRPDQVMHLEADIRRLSAATGWRPRTTLEVGVRETVAWYREHDAGH